LKQQLKCVNVIKKAVDQRLSKLKEGDQQEGDWTDESEQWQNYLLTPGVKLHALPLDEVLKNDVAISYFLDYMGSVGGTNFLLMYFNTAGEKNFMIFFNSKKVSVMMIHYAHSLETTLRATIYQIGEKLG